MANLDPNRDKSCSVIDLVYNDSVYIGSYEDCCEFIEEQGDDYFLYKIVKRDMIGSEKNNGI